MNYNWQFLLKLFPWTSAIKSPRYIKKIKKSFRNIILRVSETVGLRPGPEDIKHFSYSTQLSTKFILLINVKMPTIVGILTFVSMINTTRDLKRETSLFVGILVFMSSWNFMLSWFENEKSFIASGPGIWVQTVCKYKFISSKELTL